jgi:hypothetical protein
VRDADCDHVGRNALAATNASINVAGDKVGLAGIDDHFDADFRILRQEFWK